METAAAGECFLIFIHLHQYGRVSCVTVLSSMVRDSVIKQTAVSADITALFFVPL